MASRRSSGRNQPPPNKKRQSSDPLDAKPTRIKVMTSGATGSGKSCLVKRFCEKRFVSKYISTVGIDYGVKPHTIRGMPLKVNFWDASGHPDYLEIRNEFYKDTEGLLLVYDVTDSNSFDELDDRLKEARTFGVRSTIPVAVCANKVDLSREVSEPEGLSWANGKGYRYFETSAAAGANVNEVFEWLFTEIIKQRNR